MKIIEFINVSKGYKEDKKIKYVFKNNSFAIEHTGLVGILGKSGSGKTTLLNLISTVDKPTSGQIKFYGKDIRKLSDAKINYYRNKHIGNIFQAYHLLEKETVEYNVILPALILGTKKKKAQQKAYELLKNVGIDKKLWKEKCMNLSGGEKQRVAIARAMINNPEIILADEPTGALDSENSLKVMALLRKLSLERLVIVVSHNKELIESFAERIITLKDGKIIEDKIISSKYDIPSLKKTKHRHLMFDKWTGAITKTNINRRKKRNTLAIVSMSFSIMFCLLMIGFKNGAPNSIEKAASSKLDYGCATLYKEINKETNASGINIVQTIRPALGEIELIKQSYTNYEFVPNLDALITQNITISLDNNKMENDLLMRPIFRWDEEYVDESLLLEGEMPKEDRGLNEVLINKAGKKYLFDRLGRSPINYTLHLDCTYEYHYYTNDDFNPVIVDILLINKSLLIKGIVDELEYLQTPRIYYSYTALSDIAELTLLPNLSTFLNRDISWLSLINESKGNEDITSFSFRMFANKNINSFNIKQDISKFEEPYKISNESVLIEQSLNALLEAASMGLNIFIIICFIGTILIISIISFSSFTEDKKTSAILKSFGAEDSSIINIYIQENLLVGFISLLVGFIFSLIFEKLFNLLVSYKWNFSNIIQIPLKQFLGINLFLPILIVIFVLMLIIISSVIPYSATKKISLKSELNNE